MLAAVVVVVSLTLSARCVSVLCVDGHMHAIMYHVRNITWYMNATRVFRSSLSTNK